MGNTENNKINIKARVDRHLRIIRSGGLNNNSILDEKRFGYSIQLVLLFVIFIFPVYPSLASFVYNNSSYDFYRGYIDESSIIEAYYAGDVNDILDVETPIIETEDSFLSVNTILTDKRDLVGTKEVIVYEVKPGESFYSIANSFGVTVNSVLWANNFDVNHTLRPGEVIKVPPVSGLLHQVSSGDTISSIAKKYNIEESKIRAQNGLGEGNVIKIGDVLVIPGAIKVVETVYKASPKTTVTSTASTTTSTSGGYGFSTQANSSMTTDKGSYRLVRRQPQHSFAWGNCTWYVSQYKNVNWGGNANQWITNAKKQGHSTGTRPQVGAIIQFSGTGYNPRYGHVGIVMEVYVDHIIVSDMNYRRINEVTYRRVPINDRSIDGYIYVD